MMSRVAALLAALELQRGVGDQVRPEELQLASRCKGWTIREVLRHSIGVTRKFTHFASGATDEPHGPPGDLVGGDHRTALGRTVEAARTAWTTADMSRRCRLSFGTFSAEAAAGINLFDVLAHTWDIAAPLGLGLDEHDAVWVVGLDAARHVIGSTRDPAHYGTEVTVSESASGMSRFLAFLGRVPLCP